MDRADDIGTLGGFHRATTHPEQVGTWWDAEPTANIGVRLGGVARFGLIEGDTEAANQMIEQLARTWTRTWTYKSSRGLNRIVRVPRDIPERPVRNVFETRIGAGLEVKTGAGFIVVPPSIHPSGHVYQWVAGHAPGDVELADMPQEIADEVRRLDAHRAAPKSEPTQVVRLREGFDAARTLDALRYLDADDRSTWRDVGLALKHTGDPEARRVWDRWSASSAKYEPDEQAKAWASFAPTSITVASIFHHAQGAGWNFRRAA